MSLLVYENRLVIPESMRKEILLRLHDGHLSLSKCRKRLQYSVWWPKASRDLSSFVESCSFCMINRRKNKAEPMRSTRLPERPWQKLGADLFELHGKNYLIVDYFSRCFELEVVVRADSKTIAEKFKAIFARFGIPDILRTDGGPQFTAKYFKCFVNNYSFMHEVTNQYFSQPNGCAERAV